jgi:hypothetical protein
MPTLCTQEQFQMIGSNMYQVRVNELGLGDDSFERKPYLESSEIAEVQLNNLITYFSSTLFGLRIFPEYL